ncbi:hypothetical protein [Saccharothrix longispora]|uniref:hypothetical protein n=1 Tax=Saccharothrix longispora TaxID=33920 RepID=UPI0028FDB3FE|nr:hypothetical protein [Saccharothrix longispora]MBY8848247.1 hypothetical protein [Saccharothrix sp. MB29]MDU0290410.1 hypothetical protein [Saccharothrix longispora]
MSTHVFVDESRRSSYLLVAALVDTRRLVAVRSLMRGLRVPGERRLHFKSESDTVRKDVVGRLVDAGLRCRVYQGRGPVEAVRQVCLARLVADLVEEGAVERLVLDARGPAEDRVDRRVITRSLRGCGVPDDSISYEHLASHGDPALWVPDAVAWCQGAGGDWRRRVAPVVETVVDIGVATRRQQVR